MVSLTTIINWLKQKKNRVTDQEVALANMLVHHIQVAEQKPTAEVKK